ncbi:hypothetical protein SZN_19922 [Streptomyces zinciresistens K42]|uniref:Uncharacterized protein n=1 Tax=Streptomyces zinciresistens K42 TaxID=700597 RepID=G2GEQ1_9ACTN|nr:hypothetical protein [Streptomyces zinciresistens]EGX58012.1 hypothetical protein SZN_19922 [Streptomyces zinciresistens K42]
MHPSTHLALHHLRAADLRCAADLHSLAVTARSPRTLRTRLGWTLVEVGLRLAAPSRAAIALP